jgi:sugar phosphate isomerase/epimerase
LDKKDFKNWTVGLSTPFDCLNEAHFAEYARLGIGAFELSVDAEDYERVDIQSVARIAEQTGILPWSFHLPFYYLPHAIIDVTDEDGRKEAVAFQSEQIRRASDAGFRHIVVHPSSEPISDAVRAQHFFASKKSLEELSKVCNSVGVVMAVENLPRTCLANTSKELLSLIDGLDGVGICFDVNHLLIEKHDAFLRAIAPKLVTLHLSDYDFVDERHWLPGEGKMDWNAFIKGLESVGYDGPLMYEVNRKATSTIARERAVSPSEFAQNAHEMINGLPLTPRGRILV